MKKRVFKLTVSDFSNYPELFKRDIASLRDTFGDFKVLKIRQEKCYPLIHMKIWIEVPEN